MNLQELLPPPLRDALARLLLALLAVMLVWLVRGGFLRLFKLVITRIASRVHRDKLDEVVLAIITIPVRLLVIALSLFVAGLFLLSPGSDPTSGQFVVRLINTLMITALAVALFKAIGIIAESTQELLRFTGIEVQDALLPFFRTALRLLVIIFATLMILNAWGTDVAGLIAGLGIGGLAFALAAQDTLANLFGFTTIVGDQPLRVGEFIAVGEVSGTVEHVGLRSTRIRQLNQALVTVPNSSLASSNILNWSRLQKRQVDYKLGMTYTTSSAQMRALLTRIRALLAEREHVQSDSIVVYFTDFGDSALNVLIRCFVLLPDWAEFTAEKEEINLAVMGIVEELGLSIAFPSRSVYIEQTPESPPAPPSFIGQPTRKPNDSPAQGRPASTRAITLRDYAPDEASDVPDAGSAQGEDPPR